MQGALSDGIHWRFFRLDHERLYFNQERLSMDVLPQRNIIFGALVRGSRGESFLQ